MIYPERAGREWSKEDKKLALAYQILENERCQYCGQYLWICRSDNKYLSFAVRSDTCYADAELNRKESAENKKRPGEHDYVIPTMIGDRPLPTRREYYESLLED